MAKRFMGGGEAPAGDKPGGAPPAAAGGDFMGTAQQFVEAQLQGRQEGSGGVAEEHSKGPAEGGTAGIMGLAQQFMGSHGVAQAEAGASQAPAAGGAAGLMGMAQSFMGSKANEEADAGAGSGGGGTAQALLGAAQTFMGGGGGEAVQVGGAPGGAVRDAGLVDKLLAVFQAQEGRKFTGGEGDYDKLAGMAHSALGTPIGRDLLKSWVKQRLGI